MSVESSIALAITCFIVMVTPGPGILALVGHAMARGLRQSAAFITGMVFGDLVFLILVVAGLAMIARSFETTFLIIRILAAAYLVYLGIKAWRAGGGDATAADAPASGGMRGFFSGLLLTLSNPKVILFYVGILPNFFDLASLAPLDAVIAVTIVLSVLVCVLISYAATASRARAMLKNDKTRKLINRGAGSVMIGAGISIVVR